MKKKLLIISIVLLLVMISHAVGVASNDSARMATGRVEITIKQKPGIPQVAVSYPGDGVLLIGIPQSISGGYWDVYVNGELVVPSSGAKE